MEFSIQQPLLLLLLWSLVGLGFLVIYRQDFVSWISTGNIRLNWAYFCARVFRVVRPTTSAEKTKKPQLWTMVSNQFTLTDVDGNEYCYLKMKVTGFIWNKFDETLAKGIQMLGGNTSQAPGLEILASEDSCSICYEPYESGSKVAVLPCNHVYHLSFAGQWFMAGTSLTCPKCRQEFELHLAPKKAE